MSDSSPYLIGPKIVVAAIAVFALFQVGRLADSARKDLDSIAKDTHQTALTVNGAVGEVAATAMLLNQLTGTLNSAAADQRAYWQKTTLETYKTMAALRLVLVRTDHNLNDPAAGLGATLASAKTALDNTSALSDSAAADLASTTAEIKPALDNLARASSAAADTMADPHLRETLAHADESAQNLALATASASHTMTTVDDGVTREFNELFAPVSKIKTAVLFVVEAAGRFLGY